MTNNNTDYKYLFKLTVIGDYNSGVTSIINRYTGNDINYPGLDLHFKSIEVDGEIIKLQIWDRVFSCERFRGLSTNYYRGSHGAIFVYNVRDVLSFKSIKENFYPEYKELRLETRNPNNRHNKNIKSKIDYKYDYQNYTPPVLILGTKSDLRDQSNYDKCVDFNEVREFAKSINATPFEVSSKDNIGINESFTELITSIKSNYLKHLKNYSDTLPTQYRSYSNCIINY